MAEIRDQAPKDKAENDILKKSPEEIEKELKKSADDALKLFYATEAKIKSCQLGRNATLRAFRWALHDGLTTTRVFLQSEEEKKVAIYFKILLDNMFKLKVVLMACPTITEQLNKGDKDE